jgi:hypothetical protein
MPAPSKCVVCNVPTDRKCSECKTTFYCCRDCQVADWSRHKKKCRAIVRAREENLLTYRRLKSAPTTDDVYLRVRNAVQMRDWREVTRWNGRAEEICKGKQTLQAIRILHCFAFSNKQRFLILGEAYTLVNMRLICDIRRRVFQTVNLFHEEARTLLEVADHMLMVKDYVQAYALFRSAGKIAEKNGFFGVEAAACLGMGQVNFARDETVEYLTHFTIVAQALPLSEQNRSFMQLSYYYQDLLHRCEKYDYTQTTHQGWLDAIAMTQMTEQEWQNSIENRRSTFIRDINCFEIFFAEGTDVFVDQDVLWNTKVAIVEPPEYYQQRNALDKICLSLNMMRCKASQIMGLTAEMCKRPVDVIESALTGMFTFASGIVALRQPFQYLCLMKGTIVIMQLWVESDHKTRLITEARRVVVLLQDTIRNTPKPVPVPFAWLSEINIVHRP